MATGPESLPAACPQCGYHQVAVDARGGRWMRCLNPQCNGSWQRPKAENEKRIRSRPKESLSLGKRFSPGYCEDCRLPEDEVRRRGMSMHGHHVLELGEPDASDERTNILVLCTGCHEGVHLRRRYIGQLYDRRSEEDAA